MFEFEHDTTRLLNQAIRTQPAGSTALYNAVYLGLSEMRKAKKPRKALLVISDGEDNHSRYTAEDIVRTAKESDTQIYTIGIHNPSVNIRYMREAELKDMARVSGGRYFRVENLDGLAEKRDKSAESCTASMFLDTSQVTRVATANGAKFG